MADWDTRPIVPLIRGEQPGYHAAHHRVYTAKGKASTHACVSCDSQAAQWAYDHTDPNELTEEQEWKGKTITVSYSLDPAYYQPMCFSCHTIFDRSRGQLDNATLSMIG